MTSSPTKRVEIFAENNLDCPSASCNGWLRMFADSPQCTPNFVRCSSEINGVSPDSCTCKVMFAKFSSTCSVCLTQIKKHALIASKAGPSKVWVHCRCYTEEESVFALCQRCHSIISDENDAISTTCNGVVGFCHAKCAPSSKKRLFPQDDEEELTSSQDTSDSVDSLICRKGKALKTNRK